MFGENSIIMKTSTEWHLDIRVRHLDWFGKVHLAEFTFYVSFFHNLNNLEKIHFNQVINIILCWSYVHISISRCIGLKLCTF